MGVLVQVENGEIALEIEISWPMKRLKGGLVFFLLGFGGESGIE
jgi:hypothetical protein